MRTHRSWSLLNYLVWDKKKKKGRSFSFWLQICNDADDVLEESKRSDFSTGKLGSNAGASKPYSICTAGSRYYQTFDSFVAHTFFRPWLWFDLRILSTTCLTSGWCVPAISISLPHSIWISPSCWQEKGRSRSSGGEENKLVEGYRTM